MVAQCVHRTTDYKVEIANVPERLGWWPILTSLQSPHSRMALILIQYLSPVSLPVCNFSIPFENLVADFWGLSMNISYFSQFCFCCLLFFIVLIPWGLCASVRVDFQNPKILPLKSRTNISIMCTRRNRWGKTIERFHSIAMFIKIMTYLEMRKPPLVRYPLGD